MKAIYLKEMRSYFHSLAAYIYFALFIAATGVYFSVICMSYGYTDYSQYVFSNSTILYIVIVPILTMRLFAEEKKQRTDQLLYTSPIRPGSIVLGKYLASVTLLAMSMLVSLIEAGVLSMFGSVSWKTVLTGCLGYFLLGACLMAVGMFVSSITDNQMIAAALSFAATAASTFLIEVLTSERIALFLAVFVSVTKILFLADLMLANLYTSKFKYNCFK